MSRSLPVLKGEFDSQIRLPGSKSLSIRALTTAALAKGRSQLYGGLVAEDTEAMIEMLRAFGINIEIVADIWNVDGTGGALRAPDGPLDAGESGLAARIGPALAVLTKGVTTIEGRLRKERPIKPLLDVLASKGVKVKSDRGGLPVSVTGVGRFWGGVLELGEAPTSQLLTALLLLSPLNSNRTYIRTQPGLVSGGYIDLTISVMRAFQAYVLKGADEFEVENRGYRSAIYQIEPDASAAVYPMVAAAITGSRVTIKDLTSNSVQPDIVVAEHLRAMGCRVSQQEEGMVQGLVVEGPSESLRAIEVDMSDAPDGAMALAVACLFADGPSRISGLGTLRYKESDRIESMSEGLAALGAEVESGDDFLVIRPGVVRPAVIDPHGDHRVAMSLSLVGLRVDGVEVGTPEVVDKTWPDFWTAMTRLVA